MLIDLLTAAVLAFFLTRIVGALRHIRRGPVRRHWLRIVTGLRLRHFLPAPLVLAAVMGTALLLLQVPFLDFGWWTAIGGIGNPVTGSTERTVGTSLEWIIPLVFLTLLAPVLPLFAEREEQIFRLGAESDSWPRRAWRCVAFGAVHAIVGIPIGVALALSVGGAYFMASYLLAHRRTLRAATEQWSSATAVLTATATRPLVEARRAALLECTQAHLAYNLMIVGLVLGSIVWWLVAA